MARQSIEINRDEIRGMINSASEQHELTLTNEELQIVNEVLDILPKTMTAPSFSRWCNDKVEKIISRYPDLKPKSDLIREEVRTRVIERLSEAPAQEAIDELNVRIVRDQPSKLSPGYIYDNYKDLYTKLHRHFRTKDNKGIDWDRVTKELPPEFASRWSIEKRKQLDEIMSELNQLLLAKEIIELSPAIILRNYSKIYKYLERNVRNSDGNIDWKLVYDNLSPEFQPLWRRTIRYEEARPKKEYTDETEVEEALALYPDKIHTLLEIQNLEDQKIGQKIYENLIKMAKKGNLAAESKLLSVLESVFQTWIDKKLLPHALQYHNETAREVIKRCIYLYQGKGDFLKYVLFSLYRMSKGILRKKIGIDAMGVDNPKLINTDNSDWEFYDEPTDEY